MRFSRCVTALISLAVLSLGLAAFTATPTSAQRYYERCYEAWDGRNDRYCNQQQRRGQLWEPPAEKHGEQDPCNYYYAFPEGGIPSYCRNNPYSTYKYPY